MKLEIRFLNLQHLPGRAPSQPAIAHSGLVCRRVAGVVMLYYLTRADVELT